MSSGGDGFWGGTNKGEGNHGLARRKTVVIVGPTGSGKTGVAIRVAKAIEGEVISADSRAIYRGMDVGTAKPTIEERQGVPHFGLDLVEPGERFTAADWKWYAEEKIEEINQRGHVAIVAGGTGLYVDALVFDYQFNEIVQKSYADRTEMSGDYVIFGIKWEMEKLRERLKQRIEQMFCTELYEETRRLVKKYGWENQAMTSDVYRYADLYMRGEISIEKAKELTFYRDYHLARRQMTWFKRNNKIKWLPLDRIYDDVIKYIQDE